VLHAGAGRPGDRLCHAWARSVGAPEDCANAIALAADEKERLIEWSGRDRTGVFVAAIEVKALDRNRLLADVAKVLSEHT